LGVTTYRIEIGKQQIHPGDYVATL